ncbi:MAG: flippase [Candidatus Hodarchaeota archaeon]
MKNKEEKIAGPIVIQGSMVARNTLLNFTGQVLPLLVGIITIPFIIRGLGTARFGLLSLAWVILGYFAIFDIGLSRATTKFVAEALGKDETKKISSIICSAVASQIAFGIAGTIVLRALTPFLVERILNIPPNLSEEAKAIFYIVSFSIPVVLISSSFRGVLEARQRFDLVNIVKIPSGSAIFLLPLIGVLLGFGLPGIVVLMLCARILVLIAYLALSLYCLPSIRENISLKKKMLKQLLSFGGWITVSSIVSPILVYIDRFFISSLQTLEAVTYYTAPYEMVTRLWIIPTSLAMTLFPAFSTIGEMNKERLGLLYNRAIKYLLLGLGLIVLLLMHFAEGILRIWLGTDFAIQSILVLQILAFGILINSLARIPFSLLQALGRPDLPAKFHLLEMPLYVVAVWFLVGKMGIHGAAIAWTLRVILDAALLFSACAILKIVPIRIFERNGLWQIFVICAILILSFSLSILARGDIIKQAIIATLLTALFGWIAVRYTLDSAEKDFLSTLISRIASFRK